MKRQPSLTIRYRGTTQRVAYKEQVCFVLLSLALLLISHPVIASELGVTGTFREIGRLHSDSDSIGSKVILQTNEIFVENRVYDSFTYLLNEKRERLALIHPDGTRHFTFDFRRHIQRLKYQTNTFDIDLTASVLDLNSNDGLYERITNDDRDQFFQPALSGKYRVSNWELQLGGWDESDVQTFSDFSYTLLIQRTFFVGARYRFLEDHSVRVECRNSDRVYPANYNLRKGEIDAIYRSLNILTIGENVEWKEISLQVLQTRYPDINTHKLDLTNRFKFRLFGLDHFLSHRLRFTDRITTHHEGAYKYSLIETDEAANDIWQNIEYAGFRRIRGSNFFLSWRYRIEDSLIENVILDQDIQIKIVYAF